MDNFRKTIFQDFLAWFSVTRREKKYAYYTHLHVNMLDFHFGSDLSCKTQQIKLIHFKAKRFNTL